MEDTRLESTPGAPVQVERWPSEVPLFGLVVLAAIGIWILLALSIVGAVYALLIGLFFFVTHLVFVAHLRGSAVRLSPEQFPELHARVRELATRAGIERVPDAYIMQAGGILNAFATKFLRSRFIVLYSDLLEACGADEKARDMVIGHELGHIKAGHLEGMWLLMPGFFVPFLGAACSRAREYTCDRYGLALCGEPRGALTGLAILAAGGRYGPKVNLQALVHQKRQMDTGLMTIGKWLMGHPPLCDRVAALQPELTTGLGDLRRGPLLASVGLGLFLLLGVGGTGYLAWKGISLFRNAVTAAEAAKSAGGSAPAVPEHMRKQVDEDLEMLAATAERIKEKTGRYPADIDALYAALMGEAPAREVPLDPFSGDRYNYNVRGDQFLLWSNGPDGQSDTADDIDRYGGAPTASSSPPPSG